MRGRKKRRNIVTGRVSFSNQSFRVDARRFAPGYRSGPVFSELTENRVPSELVGRPGRSPNLLTNPQFKSISFCGSKLVVGESPAERKDRRGFETVSRTTPDAS